MAFLLILLHDAFPLLPVAHTLGLGHWSSLFGEGSKSAGLCSIYRRLISRIQQYKGTAAVEFHFAGITAISSHGGHDTRASVNHRGWIVPAVQIQVQRSSGSRLVNVEKRGVFSVFNHITALRRSSMHRFSARYHPAKVLARSCGHSPLMA